MLTDKNVGLSCSGGIGSACDPKHIRVGLDLFDSGWKGSSPLRTGYSVVPGFITGRCKARRHGVIALCKPFSRGVSAYTRLVGK
jgi:hypothetical protein